MWRPWGERLPDGTIGYYPRDSFDCWSACCATVLQVPIWELPELGIRKQLGAGETPPEEINASALRTIKRWLAGCGLRVVFHKELPFEAERWIGVVPVVGAFRSHGLVMTEAAILFDPPAAADEICERTQPKRYPRGVRRVRRFWLDQIRCGFTFEPVDDQEERQ